MLGRHDQIGAINLEWPRAAVSTFILLHGKNNIEIIKHINRFDSAAYKIDDKAGVLSLRVRSKSFSGRSILDIFLSLALLIDVYKNNLYLFMLFILYK